MDESNISFKGWLIRMTEDREEDCIKIFHEAYPPGTWDVGRQDLGNPKHTDCKSIDISPYSSSIEDCCAVIELGFPTRKQAGGVGPLSHAEIENLWINRFRNPLPERFAYRIIN